MKKSIIVLSLLFCGFAYADTITIKWMNAEGTQHAQTTCEYGNDVTLPKNTPTKYGYEFVGWQLPQYIPIAYLENVASETYINTGVYANQNSKLVVDYNIFDCPSSGAIYSIIGSDLVNISQYNTNFVAFGTKQASWAGIVGMGTRHTITADRNSWKINDTLIEYSPLPADSFISTPLMIFAKNTNNISNCVIQLYSLKLYQNDILVHDYVPALDENYVACLYDRIEEVFLYSSGTGNFTAGPIYDYD